MMNTDSLLSDTISYALEILVAKETGELGDNVVTLDEIYTVVVCFVGPIIEFRVVCAVTVVSQTSTCDLN